MLHIVGFPGGGGIFSKCHLDQMPVKSQKQLQHREEWIINMFYIHLLENVLHPKHLATKWLLGAIKESIKIQQDLLENCPHDPLN